MPVSAHPAFPAIVALWFAGLLGLGIVVLPSPLIGRIAETTGLSAAFVAAQPPLDVSTRLGIALAAGILGALAGLGIARAIARGRALRPAARGAGEPTPRDDDAAATAKRPISAHDELFEGGLDADPASTFENNEAEDFRCARSEPETAPIEEIGEEIGGGTIENLDAARDPASEDANLLDLGRFEEAADADSHGAWGCDPLHEADSPQEAGTWDDGTAAAPPAEPAEPAHEMEAAHQPVAPLSEDRRADSGCDASADVAIVELVDRFARALSRHREGSALRADAAARESAEGNEAWEGAAEDIGLPDPVRAAPIGDPSMHAAEALAPEPEMAPPVPSLTELAPSPRMPDALREIDFDYDSEFDEDDDDGVPALDLSFSLARSARPSGHPDATAAGIGSVAAGMVEEEDEEADDGGSEENYPSLLAMKSPLGVQREPVRLADEAEAGDVCEDVIEPIAAFPARDARHPDAERALRDALEKLQRMSGAA
ncbi:hypothetical protein [Tsuneonella sp. SYSU-LHT278]|uniref:hypothetical protein n=1 Tax=Tsuneonella sediminis TaxID=3416089 RepID=UPI003F790689